MSVILRGMKMPDSCIACKFGREVNYTGDFKEKCLINDKCGYVSVRKPRLDTCPLTEIKEPHGRLIAEKTITEIRYHDADGYHIVNGEQLCELEIDAETVIEAKGENI